MNGRGEDNRIWSEDRVFIRGPHKHRPKFREFCLLFLFCHGGQWIQWESSESYIFFSHGSKNIANVEMMRLSQNIVVSEKALWNYLFKYIAGLFIPGLMKTLLAIMLLIQSVSMLRDICTQVGHRFRDFELLADIGLVWVDTERQYESNREITPADGSCGGSGLWIDSGWM